MTAIYKSRRLFVFYSFGGASFWKLVKIKNPIPKTDIGNYADMKDCIAETK